MGEPSQSQGWPSGAQPQILDEPASASPDGHHPAATELPAASASVATAAAAEANECYGLKQCPKLIARVVELGAAGKTLCQIDRALHDEVRSRRQWLWCP